MISTHDDLALRSLGFKTPHSPSSPVIFSVSLLVPLISLNLKCLIFFSI